MDIIFRFIKEPHRMLKYQIVKNNGFIIGEITYKNLNGNKLYCVNLSDNVKYIIETDFRHILNFIDLLNNKKRFKRNKKNNKQKYHIAEGYY